MQDRDPASTTCRLILVRHATASGNGRFLGQKNVPLAVVGQKELATLVEKCSPHAVSTVYSSDLKRARDTADALAEHFGVEVQPRPALREMHFGDWQGMSWEAVIQRFPDSAQHWVNQFPHYTIPRAERFQDFKRRVQAGLQELVAENRGRCSLVVTHAGVLRVIVGEALGLPDENFFRIAQDPCGINVIDYHENAAVVQCVNV